MKLALGMIATGAVGYWLGYWHGRWDELQQRKRDNDELAETLRLKRLKDLNDAK